MIDTTGGWDGVSFATEELAAGLSDNLSTVGQTFGVGIDPVDHILQRFSFWLAHGGNQETRFRAYVMEWQGLMGTEGPRATGAILYQSEERVTSPPSGVMQEFAFEVGALDLTPGKKYVAFLNASAFFDGRDNRARIGSPKADVYGGGEIVFQYTGNDFSSITHAGWGVGFGGNAVGGQLGYDAAFQAVFAAPIAVPEPGTWPLLATGLLGLGGYGYRQRRRVT